MPNRSEPASFSGDTRRNRRRLRSSRADTDSEGEEEGHTTPTAMPRVEDEDVMTGRHSPNEGWAYYNNPDRGTRAEAPNTADQATGMNGANQAEGVEADHELEESEEEESEEGSDESEFDPKALGLKEISNLASFTVSSSKHGCGVKELRDDDVNQYWQSDGPQPHRLNIHFIKRVEIRALRLYLDYELDESYTPTKIQITAGFSPNQTIPFTTMDLLQPKGWIDVPIEGAGGGHDGHSLCCWFVRVNVLENHQNGKDTHIRGVKVYALDEDADTAENNALDEIVLEIEEAERRRKGIDEQANKKADKPKFVPGAGGLTIPSFMREPEIR